MGQRGHRAKRVMMACQRCNGSGLLDDPPPGNKGGPWLEVPEPKWQCPQCCGSGETTVTNEAMTFDKDAVRARCEAAKKALGDDLVLQHSTFSEISEIVALAKEVTHTRADLPAALDEIDRLEGLEERRAADGGL